ncbi:hypothetical protein ONJ16_27730, partial [Salmonella enterica subsp. enterica serovar Montevideo]|nr:hypothetical protein [Salmonella enterica subsp. enterica serovar Montevideo]
CANDCTYCGFSMSNRIKRKTLDEVDIQRECDAIRKLGFEHLFLDMLKEDTGTVEAHLTLGNLFRSRGEVDRAIRIHQTLME